MKLIRPAVTLFALLTLITGVAYPLAVTAIAEVGFKDEAHGSLIVQDGRVLGSRLIGQSFTDPRYFWGRPSATAPMANNRAASGGSNLGPSNPALHDAVKARVAALRAADPGNAAPVPVDLVTASASGLDPHISPAAAIYQASRIARLRGLPLARVEALIAAHTEGRQFGILGEPRVSVLELNLALDAARGWHRAS
ncbi:potassium-transporting ATPase subunit KdpC [Chitiniphilus purpureus]|uniref:Potassium-transporting ATPase KdpC subunit n=1 Tax=Chitiniphilus purpureus TaxID=2981137 RepID=A0ABY6DKM7_9NEIS|nr:potassium-transporting ATPase subunit KdpC [Chitiniphilus sp. CD1]UXY14915.1 potassium-transporting ATPase subunit KdpC [Chitiniphilus sp. CD1]